MHAGVTNIQIDPGKVDETLAKYRDAMVPMVGQVKGLNGLMLLVDRSTGKSISIGLWDTEDDAKAYQTGGGFSQAVTEFSDVFKNTPVREVYEVALRAMK